MANPSPTPRKPATTKATLTPSQRRDELRLLLRSGWQDLPTITERIGASRATAFRRLKELEATEGLEVKNEGHKLLWRLPAENEHPLHITTSEMVALRFIANALNFLAGTGIKEDIDALLARLAHAMKKSDYAHWKNLDRKLFDMNEGVHEYGEKLDVVNDVITALLREERITCALKDGRKVKIEPYTLVLYKKGLYIAGFSHAHGELRTFGLDKIEDTERAPGDCFAYPADFTPLTHFAGPFGMIRGPAEDVVVRFDKSVAYYVTRRLWHPTQRFCEVDGQTEMRLEPEGTSEMVSWILSFGGKAEVIGPPGLREKVAAEARGAAARYATTA